MKRYIAALEIEDDEEIIDASVSYSYRSNGMNYKATERMQLKEESEDARNKTYEDGLNDAWEAARTVVDCKVPFDFWELSSGQSMLAVFRRYSVKEAIEKIREYEEEQKKAAEIKIGDKVTDDDGWEGVVTWISPDGEYLLIIQKDGTALHWKKESFKKTGRHFSQIEEVLKRLQEGE
jgi:preprotein translocase subunit YajC